MLSKPLSVSARRRGSVKYKVRPPCARYDLDTQSQVGWRPFMKSKAYFETTIVSDPTARPSRDLITAAHQQITQQWWQTQRAHFDLFMASPVLQEAQAEDPEAAARRLVVLHDMPMLTLSEEATQLAQAPSRRGLFAGQRRGRRLAHCYCGGKRNALPAHLELHPYCKRSHPQRH
jgi:hypothetical protein